MTNRYLCVRCEGETCPRCSGRGWVGEGLVKVEQRNNLAEVVAKNLTEKKIAAIGQEEWAKKAVDNNLTFDQFTEVEIWQATGPIHYQFMALTDETIDALANLVGIEVPPLFVQDRFKIVGD